MMDENEQDTRLDTTTDEPTPGETDLDPGSDYADDELDSTAKVGARLGAGRKAFIPLSKAYRFAALYLTPEQIKQAAMWKKPSGWPSFVPWTAPIVKACQMWLNPNIGAAMEIADRTEGKVRQTLEVENRGVVALPMIQIGSSEEWRSMFSPVGNSLQKLGPVEIEMMPTVHSESEAVVPVKRKRGRPRKNQNKG